MEDRLANICFIRMKAYYERILGEDIDSFIDSCTAPLPISFRVNKTVPNYQLLIDLIRNGTFVKTTQNAAKVGQPKSSDSSKSDDDVFNGLTFKESSFCPGLFSLNVSKQLLKENAKLADLHQTIQKASDSGLLTRQEVVSAIPVIFLDPKPSDLILDLCAAPGSKTSQLQESLIKNQTGLHCLTQTGGGIVANELDGQRACLLVHQLKRIGLPNAMVVNHPGQEIPYLVDDKSSSYDKKIYFDKVLADVPCSGDGAIRKYPSRLENWSTKEALNIHSTQVALLQRAIKLVKINGLVIYSTCSLNPIENEAVVANVISRANDLCPGSVSIIDAKLNGFKTKQGLESWPVLLEKKQEYDSHQGNGWQQFFREFSSEKELLKDGLNSLPSRFD